MSNFNSNRTIDLKEYLPNILKEVKELKAIMGAEQPIIERLWQAVEDCMDDQFIETSTLNGIARREKMLSITPFTSDTLDDRRFRLHARYNENVPYTRVSLQNMLSALCGPSGYSIHFITAEFTVNVRVALAAKRQEATVADLLERILPYNMIFTVDLLYNRWSTVKAFTWGGVANRTWRELREEVLT